MGVSYEVSYGVSELQSKSGIIYKCIVMYIIYI